METKQNEKVKLVQIENEGTFKEFIKDCLKTALKERNVSTEELTQQSDICRMKEAILITGLAKSTIYGKTHKKTIPHIKKGGGLRFSRIDLTNWIMEGKVKTEAQLQNEVDETTNNYLTSKKRKKK